MRHTPFLCLPALVCSILAVSPQAHANDLSSHLWVTEHALDALPAGCEVTQFMKTAGLRQMVDNGTMFPDHGYVPNQPQEVRDAGEAAHWEPFYDAYAKYLNSLPGFPADPNVRQVLAHYMGLVSHDLCDELYDSMYIERVARNDTSDLSNADEYLGYGMIDAAGPRTPPSSWIPMDHLLGIYSSLGYNTNANAIQFGVTTLGLSITGMNTITPARIGQAKAKYPWGVAHLLDAAVYGSPARSPVAIAHWWQSAWARAHDRPAPSPVIETYPPDRGTKHNPNANSIESWVNIVMAREVELASIASGAQIRILDAQKKPVPIDIDVFYAHIVQLKPKNDLAPDELYTVEIDPGVIDATGKPLKGYKFRFTTGDVSPPPTIDPNFWNLCVGEMTNPPDIILSNDPDAGADAGPDAPILGDAALDAHDAKESVDALEPDAPGEASAADAATDHPGEAAVVEPPASADSTSDGGCSCQSVGVPQSSAGAAIALLALILLKQRRRSAVAGASESLS